MQTRPQLPALTGLRFVAAAHVLLYHLFPRPVAPGWLSPILASGYVGVSLFFVLSGFILSYNYEEAVRSGGISWTAFWKARFARIYPVYFLGLVVSVPLFFMSGKPAGEVIGGIAPSVWSSTLMVQAWSPRTACVVNCPGWSISVEALFYLAFIPAALLMGRMGSRGLLGAGAVAWGAALLPPVLYLLVSPDGPGVATPDSDGEWLLRLKYHPLARLAEFVLGMAAGSLLLRRPAGRWGLDWLEVATAGGILAVLLVGPLVPYPLLHNGLLAPLFALLVYRLARGGGPLARLLSRRGWATLGGASYALYILHTPVASWLGWAIHFLGAHPSPLARFGMAGTASLGAALLVFRFFEEPARLWLRGLTTPPPAPRGSVAAPVPMPALAAD